MWQVLFLLQLCTVVVIALVNGLSLGQPATPHAGSPSAAALPAPPPPAAPGANPDGSGANSSLSDDVVRSHQLLLMLVVAALLSALLTALWLAMLRAGARVFIYAGAAGGVVMGLTNATWLLSQGNTAGLTLGLLSLCLTAGCAVYLGFNRHRVDFSVSLLATVARLVREYPAMLAAAAAAFALQLLWVVVWCTAFAPTALRARQGGVLVLLTTALLWTTQLIKAVLHTTVAGTVASWYFLSPHVPRRPTARAARRALTTSFGSLCLGSLVASTLKALRAIIRLAFLSKDARTGYGNNTSSTAVGDTVRACFLCMLGFLDVLVRYFNEYAYTQVAIYGKSFTSASRDTWTLLMHGGTGVDYLLQRDLVGSAVALAAMLSGLLVSFATGLWARANFGDDAPLWWEATVAAFFIGHASVSIVSSVIESAVCALYVCFAEDPSPLSAIDPQLSLLFSTAPPPVGTPDDEHGISAASRAKRGYAGAAAAAAATAAAATAGAAAATAAATAAAAAVLPSTLMMPMGKQQEQPVRLATTEAEGGAASYGAASTADDADAPRPPRAAATAACATAACATAASASASACSASSDAARGATAVTPPDAATSSYIPFSQGGPPSLPFATTRTTSAEPPPPPVPPLGGDDQPAPGSDGHSRMVAAAAREASSNDPEAPAAYVAFPDAGASGRRSLSPSSGFQQQGPP